MDVLVLRIEDPSCFWIAVKEGVAELACEAAYENLYATMNQFYGNYKDGKQLKPETVEKGKVYVVFSEELECWCRAVVQSVQCCMEQFRCFLVDYAKYSVVESKNIRVPVGEFTKLPYRAKKCSLYCTKPVTLHLDFHENTAKIGPAKRWDAAAIQHFQNLVEEATDIKAMVQALEDNIHQVFLFVTKKGERICVNDDLVTKLFACYEDPGESAGSSAGDLDREASQCVPVEFVGPMFAPRLKLPFGKVSPDLKTGLAGCSSVLEETSLRSRTVVNDNTVPVVNTVPSLPLKENKAVETEWYGAAHLPWKEKKAAGTDRLPQYLSSDSLQTHMVENDQQSFQNLEEERNVVFLRKQIEPSSVLETASLFDGLKKELAWNKFSGPNLTESYCWPPAAWGYDVIAISHQGNDPLLYIPPLLTFLQQKSAYQALPNTTGPLALILCSGWKKAQFVFNLLKTYGKAVRDLHPLLVIVGQSKGAAGHVEIQGCEVVVTTPYSLLRLLEHNRWLLCRLCHLVLDEIEVLFTDAAEQVFTILDCFKKATAQAQRNPLHQIIAVGTQWNKHITYLMKEFMNDPYVVITAMEEAAICGNVQQVVQLCGNSDKITELLKILDFTLNSLQKVLVFTDSVDEVEMIHKALKSKSIASLKKHKQSKCIAQCVSEQWRKLHVSGTPVVLVSTDDCLQALGVTDATCVIQFSFPSPGVFGRRLQSMSDNFCAKDSSLDRGPIKAKSVTLLTEKSACHAPGILAYLKHAEAEIPQELYDLTARILESEEDKKLSRPLCASLKAFGVCKNRTACPDRHQINVSIDMAQNIPNEIKPPEHVTILPLHIVHATNYFGRIVDKQKDKYTVLHEEMKNYFKIPTNRICVDTVEKSAFYGLAEGALCHRVQVVDIPDKGEENAGCQVIIKYVDEGRTSQVNNVQLLQLPEEFQHLPPQAVEFVLCGVKPIDNEIEWNPKVTDHIHHKIKGKLHLAKVVHVLGTTAWVDPVVRVTSFSALKIRISEYNVQSEILSTGLGIENPGHLAEIQKLCRHMEVSGCAENLEHLSTEEDIAGLEEGSKPQETLIQRNSAESCNTSGSSPCDDVAQKKEAEGSILHQYKCCHPEIKWFQDHETVTLKVKILNAGDTECKFSEEKVVFRANSGDKLYLADLVLQQPILAEKSTYIVKDREAVIVLAKEKPGAWSKLLKDKNIHVSLDFEHWKESEDESPFPFGVGKLNFPAAGTEEWFDSESETDTESD